MRLEHIFPVVSFSKKELNDGPITFDRNGYENKKTKNIFST